MEIFKKIYSYKINLDNNRCVLIDTYKDEKHIWNDVSFKNKNNVIFLGTYYSYGNGDTQEWIEYNSDFIALIYVISNNNCLETHIRKLYDIKNEVIVTGTEDEIINYYNECKHKKLVRKHL